MKTPLKYSVITLLLGISIFSCNKDDKDNNTDNSFEIRSQYDSIRSCPGGGGLFIIRLTDLKNQSENISIKLECNEKLNASLFDNEISSNKPVLEVLIKPDSNISIGNHNILVIGIRGNYTDSCLLKVEIIDWENSTELGDIVNTKKENYIYWLNTNYPNIKIDNNTQWDVYSTYPGILIVEHFTLLNDQYEMRLLNHVMIPPEDWSMIRLRERNTDTPFLAARQDSTGGNIYEILIEDYPIHFGY